MGISIKNARAAMKLMNELESLEKSLLVLEPRIKNINPELKTLLTIHVNPAVHLDLIGEDLNPIVNAIQHKILIILDEISELGFTVEEDA